MFLLRILLVVWIQAYLLGPEFAKLPMLFIHFQEHLAEDDALGFEAFIILHYADTGRHDSDHPDHEDLPFHHHHGGVVDQCAAKVWMSDPVLAVSFPELIREQAVGGPADAAELTGHTRAMLQPPRTQA